MLKALRPLKITLHDHIIIGARGHSSLKAMGLILGAAAARQPPPRERREPLRSPAAAKAQDKLRAFRIPPSQGC